MPACAGLQRKTESPGPGTSKPRMDAGAASRGSALPRYLAPVQLKCDRCSGDEPDKYAKPEPLIGESEADRDRVVQQESEGSVGTTRGAAGIQKLASQGVAHADRPMPGLERIQTSFGRHDVSGVRTQVGGSAQQASEGMGARAYTVGDRVGFKSEPDLHLAAHEAAHVVQQRRGVRLKDGVGRQGDQYEQQADAVADRVVAHQSAEELLDRNYGGEQQQALQHKCSCGGTGCSKCGGATASEDEPVQMELEANAARLFEDAGAESAVPTSSADASSGDGEGGDDDAAPGDGEAASSDPDQAETDEDQTEAAPSSAGNGGGGGGGASAEPVASASAGTEAGAPAGTSAAPAPTAGGGGTETTGAGAGCSGGGSAQCYREPSEEPEEEPDETPPNPEATHVEEQTSDEGEEDMPQGDDCAAQQAQAGLPDASAPVSEAPGPEASAAPVAGGAASASGGAGAADAAPAGAAPGGSGGGGGGGGGGSGAVEETLQSSGSPLDGVIAQTEGQRSQAVADYGASSALLIGASEGSRQLRGSAQFAASPGGTRADAARRDAAAARADRFFAGAADQLDQSIAFASQQAPDQLGARAESNKAQIAASIEMQKLAISARVDMARGQARSDAGIARRQVMVQADAFIADAESETAGAIDSLTATHAEIMGQVDTLETTTLDSVNQVYADGRSDLEGLGTTIGDEATATGEEFAATYRGFRHCTENGFWDGDLSERRSIAQEDAARSVASGYHDRIVESAHRRAREVTREGRKKDRCAVISSASVSRDTLDQQLANLVTALEGARDATIQQAQSMRADLIASIDSSLASILHQLDQQEHDQRQAADDAGYMQQLLQEQIAHAAAAALQRSVAQAATGLQSALFELHARFAASEAPDADVLDSALSQVTHNVDSALGGLQAVVEGGASLAAEQLSGAAQQGLSALDDIARSNDELTSAISGGFSSSMGQIAGTDNFASQRTGFTQQLQQSTAAGGDALSQVYDGMSGGCDATLAAAATTLTEAHTGLEQNLRQSKQGIECAITSKADEAASHEAPAWKMLVAILLVIIVIVIVIAVIVASGGAAMAALVAAAGPIGAGIIVGAAVGAVTSGLLAVASNLWSNRSWSQGVLHAMAVGAITGAIGGGLGAGVGLAFKGASVAVQLGAQVVTAGGMDVVTQFVTGGFSFEHFSWSSLGMTTIITVLTFGIGHAVSARAQARVGSPAGEPVVPGASPGEMATGPQVAEPAAPTAPATEAPPATAHPSETVPASPTSTEPSAAPATPPDAAAPATAPEATAPKPAEIPAAPAETAAPAVPESAGAAPAETPAGEPAQPATGEAAATLENTAGKSAEELTPEEVLTERDAASRSEPEPIDEPPFTTKRELPNGHEMKETPDGEFCERCSSHCVVFDKDGNPVGRDELPGGGRRLGTVSAGPEGLVEHTPASPEVSSGRSGATPETIPEPETLPELPPVDEAGPIEDLPEETSPEALEGREMTPEMHQGEVEDIHGNERDSLRTRTSGSTTGPERAQAAAEAEELGPHPDDMQGNEAEIGSEPPRERPSDLFADPEGPAPRSGEALRRPPLWEETKTTIEESAETNEEGRFVDGDGNVIEEPDYGHITGHENRRIIRAGEELGLTQEQLSEFVNAHPEYFQIEEHGPNISHANEEPGSEGYEHIVDEMRKFFRL